MSARTHKPHEIVERALELSRADGCVVIARLGTMQLAMIASSLNADLAAGKKVLAKAPADSFDRRMAQDFVMSRDANLVPGKKGEKPMMLSRFLSGALHPLIHCGYGVEFGLPGMISEGMSTAIRQCNAHSISIVRPSRYRTGCSSRS